MANSLYLVSSATKILKKRWNNEIHKDFEILFMYQQETIFHVIITCFFRYIYEFYNA